MTFFPSKNLPLPFGVQGIQRFDNKNLTPSKVYLSLNVNAQGGKVK